MRTGYRRNTTDLRCFRVSGVLRCSCSVYVLEANPDNARPFRPGACDLSPGDRRTWREATVQRSSVYVPAHVPRTWAGAVSWHAEGAPLKPYWKLSQGYGRVIHEQATHLSRPDQARCSVAELTWARIGHNQALKAQYDASPAGAPHHHRAWHTSSPYAAPTLKSGSTPG